MSENKIGSMHYYTLAEQLKNRVHLILERVENEVEYKMPEEVRNGVIEIMDSMLNICMDKEDFLGSMLTYSVISTLDNIHKLHTDKWFPKKGEE